MDIQIGGMTFQHEKKGKSLLMITTLGELLWLPVMLRYPSFLKLNLHMIQVLRVRHFIISTHKDDEDWILDSRATDHMTFDSKDFSNTTQPRQSCVANANGVTYPVRGA